MNRSRFLTGQELYALAVIIPAALLAFTLGYDLAAHCAIYLINF